MISVKIKEYKNGSLKDYYFNLDESLKKIEEDKKAKEIEMKKVDDARKEANKDKKLEN